eukprot:4454561-Pyramimonas_sp.AAC.1
MPVDGTSQREFPEPALPAQTHGHARMHGQGKTRFKKTTTTEQLCAGHRRTPSARHGAKGFHQRLGLLGIQPLPRHAPRSTVELRFSCP